MFRRDGAPRGELAGHCRYRDPLPAWIDPRAVAHSPVFGGSEWKPHFADHYPGCRRGGHIGSGCLQDFRGSEDTPHLDSRGWCLALPCSRILFCGWLFVATAMAGTAALNPRAMTYHRAATVGFFVLGLTIVPRLVKRINKARFNVLARQSPTGYAIAVLLGSYCAIAGALDVSLVFASQPFLPGSPSCAQAQNFCRIARCNRESGVCLLHPGLLRNRGLETGLGPKGVSLGMIVAFFFAGSCAIKILSVSLAGRFAGFRGLDLINLAITTNARGGPGILVLAMRGVRSRNHQLPVLHHSGCGSRPDLPARRGLARFRFAQGMAAAQALCLKRCRTVVSQQESPSAVLKDSRIDLP